MSSYGVSRSCPRWDSVWKKRPQDITFGMKTRIRTGILILGVVASSLLLWQLLGPRAPSFQGKPLDEWLNRIMVRNFQDTEAALHEMGPEAVPLILARLRKENSRLARAYRRLLPNIPPLIRRVLPWPNSSVFDHEHASMAINFIGPSTKPEVIKSLRDTSPHVRAVCAMALHNLQRGGSDLRPMIPTLAEMLKEANKMQVFTALSEIERREQIPALTKLLREIGSTNLSEAATETLREIYPNWAAKVQ